MSAENSKTQEEKQQSDSTKTSMEPQNETSAVHQYSSRPLEEQGPRDLKRVAKSSGSNRLARKNEERQAAKAHGLPRNPQDFVGASLADGRYEIVDRLGKGSMAWVFRASDRRLETDVVVKIPKPEKLGDEIRERFRRESQLLVRLAHPHVVKVLDVGEYATIPYVVMQLLSGGTLLDKMDETHGKMKRMSPGALKNWLRGVGLALDFCGKQGTVHRDVKPANILFDDDNNAYVSDFGLTKIMYGEHTSLNSSETTTGIVLGTPNYIAPEVVLGQSYDGRADQYSLGITVYHALVGKAPMQGNSATATMINQTQKRLQLLSDIRSDVPEALALAVRRSIEKDPEQRFSCCEEFAEAAIDGVRGASMSSGARSISTSPTSQPQPPTADARQSSGARPKPKKKTRRRRSSSSSMRDSPMASADPLAMVDPLDDLMGDDGADWLAGPELPQPSRRKSGGRGKTKPKKTGMSAEQRRIALLVAVGAALILLLMVVRLLLPAAPEFNAQAASRSSPSVAAPAVRSTPRPVAAEPKTKATNVTRASAGTTDGAATERSLIVLSTALVPSATNNVSHTSTPVKLNVWDGTCKAELTSSKTVLVSPGQGAWWGCGLEVQTGGQGEDLSQYANGSLNFSIRSETEARFALGFQTGLHAAGTQTSNFVTFNGESDLRLTSDWSSHVIPVARLNRGANLKDVTSLLYMHGDSPGDGKPIEIGNIYYTAGNASRLVAAGPASSSASGRGNQDKAEPAAKAPVMQTAATETRPELQAPGAHRDSIPWSVGEQLTFGTAETPVVISGPRVWSKESAEVTASLSGQYAAGGRTALSTDGALFAATRLGSDQRNNSIVVWDTSNGQQLFTAQCSPDRFVDVLLLSSDRLLAGDRRKDNLEVWKCDTGKKQPSIQCRGAQFHPAGVALSHDGQFVAAVAGDRLAVFSTKDGSGVVAMQNPADRPSLKRSSMMDKSVGKVRAASNAAPVLAQLTSLHFSPDDQQLAGHSNHPVSRIVAWNNVGELIADHGVFSDVLPDAPGNLQWFAHRDAWVVAGRLVMRETGHVVMTTHDYGPEIPAVHVLSDDTLAARIPHDASDVSIVPIPWEQINTALLNLRQHGDAALLSPETPVSTRVNLSPYLKSGTAEVKEVQKAIFHIVVRDGLKTQQKQERFFIVKVVSADDAKPVYDRMTVGATAVAGSALTPTEGDFVAVELHVPAREGPIWRVNLGSVEELGMSEAAGADISALTARIHALVVPYYIPRSNTELALPVFAQ